MLDGKLTLEDLESVDAEYYRGLILVLNQDVSESGLCDETFTTEENFFGDNRTVELKPDGATIPVCFLLSTHAIAQAASKLISDITCNVSNPKTRRRNWNTGTKCMV